MPGDLPGQRCGPKFWVGVPPGPTLIAVTVSGEYPVADAVTSYEPS